MSRRLDLDHLWDRAERRGLTPEILARRAGMRLHDRQTLLHLEGLADLTASQLVAIADILDVTVDELLTGQDPAENDGDRLYARMDAQALGAALMHFGSLTEHDLLSAYRWRPDRLNTAIAELHRRLEPGGITVHRAAGRLELYVTESNFFWVAHEKLAAVLAEAARLGQDETPFLVVAVRAHVLGPYPGPPMVAWPIADTLTRQGAAEQPGPHEATGKPRRLRPHPDLLFALNLTRRPLRSPRPGRMSPRPRPPSAGKK
jgi:hypothetical protein